MNIEGLIETLSPAWALRRAKAKQILRYYDAAQSTHYHKAVRGGGNSPDSVTHNAVKNLRGWSRYLDESHDLAIGIFDNLVNRTVGAGLVVEPILKRRNGNLDQRANDELRGLWLDFWDRPEVTGELPGCEVERLMCRAWMRDGELFTNHVMGTTNLLTHNSRVPYSIELLEADFCPMDLNDIRITHGVEKNAWGRPIAYHLYKTHPGNTIIPFAKTNLETKRVSADFITHLKFTRRFRQTRGVPIIHGIIHRLDDIKDYEESERIAARVAAAFTAWIKRTPEYTGTVDENGNVPFEMQSGMIFDGLQVGEEISSTGTERPNANLSEFRNAMLRAAASGTGTSYSSISKSYEGTYSSQRQEMVEAVEGYKKLQTFFVKCQMMPIWRRFIDMVLTARLMQIPRGMDVRQLYTGVEMRGPGVPWVDPKKEMDADALAVEKGFKSRHQVIRERGGDPRLVDKELAADTFEPKQQQQPSMPDASQPGGSADNEDSADSEDEAA